MIYCIWCGREDQSFILHVCPNGATFPDRVQWGIDGKKAPYLEEGLTKYGPKNSTNYNPNPEELDLTDEDKNWLKGVTYRMEMNDEKFDVKEAVARALDVIQNRSFADRNKLAKMINCPVCERRHRGVICAPKYAQGRPGSMTEGIDLIASQNTRKGIYGAASVAKKRFHPHPSKMKLQLVQRTQQLFYLNEPFYTDPQECMEDSRDMAQRQLKKERGRKARKTQKTQQLSRRINAALVPGGTRVGSPLVQTVTPKTYQKRKTKLEERTKKNKEVKNAGPF